MHSIAIKGHHYLGFALGLSLTLFISTFLFSYTAYADTDNSEFVVTETISPLLTKASLVLTAVSEVLHDSAPTAQASVSSNASIDELMKEIARLTALLNQLRFHGSDTASSDTSSTGSDEPSIKLLYPNGGETFGSGSKTVRFSVKWKSENLSGKAFIYLNFPDGRMCLLGTTRVSKGEFAVKLHANDTCSNISAKITSGKYLIKIATDTENPNGDMKGINDGSDNYFTLKTLEDESDEEDGAAPDIWVYPGKSTSISFGDTVSFYWSVSPTSGTTCKAAGTGINGKTGNASINLSGSWTTPKLYVDTTYGVKCTGPSGLVSYKYIDVLVEHQSDEGSSSRPVISIFPGNTITADFGERVGLVWSVTPTSDTVCYAAGTGINGATGNGKINLSGSWTTPALYTNTQYGVKCTNDSGTTYQYVDIKVPEQVTEDTTPVISYVTPGGASVGESTTFTIKGKNFNSSSVIYYQNLSKGTSATLTPSSVSSTSLTVTATPGNAGTVTFYVQNGSGEKSNSGAVYVY